MSEQTFAVPPLELDVPAEAVPAKGALVFLRRIYNTDGTAAGVVGGSFDRKDYRRGDVYVDQDGTIAVIGGNYSVLSVENGIAHLLLRDLVVCEEHDWCVGHEPLDVLDGDLDGHMAPSVTVTELTAATVVGPMPLLLTTQRVFENGEDAYMVDFAVEVSVTPDRVRDLARQLCEAGEALRAWAEANS